MAQLLVLEVPTSSLKAGNFYCILFRHGRGLFVPRESPSLTSTLHHDIVKIHLCRLAARVRQQPSAPANLERNTMRNLRMCYSVGCLRLVPLYLHGRSDQTASLSVTKWKVTYLTLARLQFKASAIAQRLHR